MASSQISSGPAQRTVAIPSRDDRTSLEARKRSSSPLRRAILRRLKIMAVCLVVYGLSIGPMFWSWYESKYLNASPWIAVFYQPLLYLTAMPLVRDLLNAYINWWIL